MLSTFQSFPTKYTPILLPAGFVLLANSCCCLLLHAPVRLEHLERVSAADAAAVLVLHPEPAAAADTPDTAADGTDAAAAAEGMAGGSSAQGSGGGAGAAGSSSSKAGGARGCVDGGAAALKMQTVMALTAQLMGRKAAVVVQVGGV